MKTKTQRVVYEATGILLMLVGAFSLVVGAMPLINPGLHDVFMRSRESSPQPFVFAALVGIAAIAASIVCSRKAKQKVDPPPTS